MMSLSTHGSLIFWSNLLVKLSAIAEYSPFSHWQTGLCTGFRRSTNQEQENGSKKEKKEYLWGYGSGVATATVPCYGIERPHVRRMSSVCNLNTLTSIIN
jgi:hypothetical protein